MKIGLLYGISTAAILIGCGAAAAPASPAPPATATASDATTLGEVIVTAQRRAERLEKVGVAVSSFSAKQQTLIGINSIQDLANFSPGLSYSSTNNSAYLRGIGRNTTNLATESGVATYIDGVYYGANASTVLQEDSLFVDRIDVLRGPQSTLYGRNSDAGAINYATVHPTKAFDAEVRTGAANYGKAYVEGRVSGPVSDRARLLIGGNYTNESSGYLNNLNGSSVAGDTANGGAGDSYFAEVQLDADVTDKFDVWAKLSTAGFSTNYHINQTLGPLGYGLTSPAQTLSPTSLYALCFLPSGDGGVPGAIGCPGNPQTPAAATPQKVIPDSIVTQSHVATTNVTNSNIYNFLSDMNGGDSFHNNVAFALSATYHLPSFDIKYTGAFQTFDIDIEIPAVPGSGVESYAIAAPASASATCAAEFGGSPAGLAGCTQPLGIDPADYHTHFYENVQYASNELDFQSTGKGPISWIGGLYWYYEQYSQIVDFGTQPYQAQLLNPYYYGAGIAPTTAAPSNPQQATLDSSTYLKEDSYAAFGQVDWSINDQLKLTGGVRYSLDSKYGSQQERVISFDVTGLSTALNYGADTPAVDITKLAITNGQFAGAGIPYLNQATGFEVRDLNATWSAWSGTVAANWTPNPSTLVYAKYDRGYKSGGFSTYTISANPETKPEFVNAYEVGLKELIAHQFQVNLAGFLYDFENDQQPLTTPVPAVGNVTVLYNIPEIRTYGLEIETLWKPTRYLDFSLNYSYLNSRVTNSGNSCFEDTTDPLALEPGAQPCPPSTQTIANVVLQSLKGETPPLVPANKISFNTLYTIPFEPGDLTLSASVIWRDREYGVIFNRPYNLIPANTRLNLRAAWTDSSNRYTVFIYCNNLLNSVGYDSDIGSLAFSNPATKVELSQSEPTLLQPRRYGIEFQYRWR